MNRVGYPLSLNQMTFTLSTTLSQHIEEEIYLKVVASAESKAERYNKMWAVREEEGKTYHTRKTFYGEEKIYWYSETKSFLNITFAQVTEFGDTRNDYYRPLNCTVNLEACRTNAQQW